MSKQTIGRHCYYGLMKNYEIYNYVNIIVFILCSDM